MSGYLFCSALGGDVLGPRQLSPPGHCGERHEIVRDHRHSPACALLPRSIGGGIDDHLADHSPAGVMRIATCDEEPREGVGDLLCVRLGPVDIKMS